LRLERIAKLRKRRGRVLDELSHYKKIFKGKRENRLLRALQAKTPHSRTGNRLDPLGVSIPTDRRENAKKTKTEVWRGCSQEGNTQRAFYFEPLKGGRRPGGLLIQKPIKNDLKEKKTHRGTPLWRFSRERRL